MWILMVVWMGFQAPACPESVITEAQSVRQRQGRVAEMAHLERRLSGCVPGTWVRFETANRYIELSETLRGDKRQSAYLEKGFAWARSAVRTDPRNSLSHEILATAYGARINQSGLMTQLRLADSVRVHAQRAVDLDPRNARALHILGRWHYEVSKLGWVTSLFAGMVTQADVSRAPAAALAHFRKAREVDDSVRNRYWLVQAMRLNGQTTAAVALSRDTVRLEPENDSEKSMQSELRAWLRMNPR
jgi:hypothetical protein